MASTFDLLAIILRNWFLPLLGLCLITGFLAAETLAPLADWLAFRNGLVASVFLLMGLTLQPRAMLGSIRRPRFWLLAILVNAIAVPVLAWLASWWLTPSMGGGLIVAAIVPCTLASASVWTRQGGGDEGIAMMVTVLTNLFCFLIVPFWLVRLLGQQTDIGFWETASKLAMLVAIPLVLAQGIRRAGAEGWGNRHKRSLSTIAQVGILVMVLIGGSHSQRGYATEGESAASAVQLTWMATNAILIHCIALAVGIYLAGFLRASRSEQIAVGISGSQKTLMVGLQIAIDAGVSLVPMIVYHAAQLLLDTMLVQQWKAESERREQGESASS